MALLTKSKNCGPVSDQSMHFWGVCCESGKQYAQVVGQRFRITMAVLDPKSSSKDESEKTVSLIVIRGGIEYLLCVLKHEEIHQVNLNLIFDKGENVVFYINGHGKVYLSGYQLTDSESDVLNDESGYLCPLVEVKSSKSKTEKKSKLSKSPQKAEPESATPKSKKKAKVEKVTSDEKISKSAFLNAFASSKNKNGEIQLVEFEEDSDESDEDFSLGDEDTDSEEESEEIDEEEDDIDSEEIEEIINEVEEIEEDDVQEITVDSKGSRKRKLENIALLDNTFNAKDSSDSDGMNSSIGRTPIPKKQMKMETSAEKKKSKKKKKLLNESVSEKPVEGQLTSPVAGRKQNSAENTPNKNPVQKLEGGVEIQDVHVGKGPVATKGKMVHVFYVGRLQNKQIFDSRLPGKKPFSFKLGAQQVIKGWDVGLLGMKVGGKRKIKIPPNMGYGSSGVETIPPNSTLFFLVELQAVS